MQICTLRIPELCVFCIHTYAYTQAMSFNEDSDDDDDNEIQSYEYVKYLQQIEKHRQSLLGLQLARQGVLSAHQTLSAIGPTCWSHDSPADGHDKLRVSHLWDMHTSCCHVCV